MISIVTNRQLMAEIVQSARSTPALKDRSGTTVPVEMPSKWDLVDPAKVTLEEFRALTGNPLWGLTCDQCGASVSAVARVEADEYHERDLCLSCLKKVVTDLRKALKRP